MANLLFVLLLWTCLSRNSESKSTRCYGSQLTCYNKTKHLPQHQWTTFVSKRCEREQRVNIVYDWLTNQLVSSRNNFANNTQTLESVIKLSNKFCMCHMSDFLQWCSILLSLIFVRCTCQLISNERAKLDLIMMQEQHANIIHVVVISIMYNFHLVYTKHGAQTRLTHWSRSELFTSIMMQRMCEESAKNRQRIGKECCVQVESRASRLVLVKIFANPTNLGSRTKVCSFWKRKSGRLGQVNGSLHLCTRDKVRDCCFFEMAHLSRRLMGSKRMNLHQTPLLLMATMRLLLQTTRPA